MLEYAWPVPTWHVNLWNEIHKLLQLLDPSRTSFSYVVSRFRHVSWQENELVLKPTAEKRTKVVFFLRLRRLVFVPVSVSLFSRDNFHNQALLTSVMSYVCQIPQLTSILVF